MKEEHNRQLSADNIHNTIVFDSELLEAASKDRMLSEITGRLYGYKLTLNLRTGKYSLIVGKGMKNLVTIFQSTDDYITAFEKQVAHMESETVEEFKGLASLESLRKRNGQEGFVGCLEYTGITDGTIEWYETTVFMGKSQGGEDVAVLLGRDVTEAHEKADIMNQLEIALASNDAKTRFWFNMSHDIRTPINGIMGLLHIAKIHREDEDRVNECLRKIETSVNYLSTLLNNVLDFDELDNQENVTAGECFNISNNYVQAERTGVTENKEILKGIRILIVEDNELNMEISQIILGEAGAIITPAENGEIAVDIYKNSPPNTFDVILMDIMMPKMDGLEATRRIRAMDREDAGTVPIIAMTANAFSEDIRKSADAGINEHIAKPLNMVSLANTIAKLVK